MKTKKPKQLHKKMTNEQKFHSWVLYAAPYLIFLTFILVTILFVILCIMFMPGNDSAIVYNWGGQII